jgi:hypothetical protein
MVHSGQNGLAMVLAPLLVSPRFNPSRSAMDLSTVTGFNGGKSLFVARIQMDFKVNDARRQ